MQIETDEVSAHESWRAPKCCIAQSANQHWLFTLLDAGLHTMTASHAVNPRRKHVDATRIPAIVVIQAAGGLSTILMKATTSSSARRLFNSDLVAANDRTDSGATRSTTQNLPRSEKGIASSSVTAPAADSAAPATSPSVVCGNEVRRAGIVIASTRFRADSAKKHAKPELDKRKNRRRAALAHVAH